MAKRFTDTNKWQRWYRNLPCKYKAFWQYLLDKCDVAGVWVVDLEDAEFNIKERIDPGEALNLLNDEKPRIVDFDNGKKWLILDFIFFQYGELRPHVKPHIPVLALINKYGIKGYLKGINTLKEKEQDKDQEKEQEEGFKKPTLQELEAAFKSKNISVLEAQKFLSYYESVGWVVGRTRKPMKSWRGAVATWASNITDKQEPKNDESKPFPVTEYYGAAVVGKSAGKNLR